MPLTGEPLDVVITVVPWSTRGRAKVEPADLVFDWSKFDVLKKVHVLAVDDAVDNADEGKPALGVFNFTVTSPGSALGCDAGVLHHGRTGKAYSHAARYGGFNVYGQPGVATVRAWVEDDDAAGIMFGTGVHYFYDDRNDTSDRALLHATINNFGVSPGGDNAAALLPSGVSSAGPSKLVISVEYDREAGPALQGIRFVNLLNAVVLTWDKPTDFGSVYGTFSCDDYVTVELQGATVMGGLPLCQRKKAAKAGSFGGDFVVSGANWVLWEANSFPKGVTHSLNTSCGDSGAFILRGSTSIWPHSGSNRVDEGGKSRQPRG